MSNSWQPSASFAHLQQRAALLRRIRDYFYRAAVLEVDTPLLAPAPVTDPHIDAIAAGSAGEGYLQTSPEYAMKRLLAAGSGPIYQICKAFRAGEQGQRHRSEFTMLEWYRPGFSLEQLRDEVATIVQLAFSAVNEAGSAVGSETNDSAPRPLQWLSYRSLFEQHLGLNPHTASVDALRDCAREHLDTDYDSDERDDWLQLLMAMRIEPKLDGDSLWFVYDFPVGQAALAKTAKNADGEVVAKRFELYVQGVELANAYDELTDASELRRRAEQDLLRRKALAKPLPPIDEALMAAMDAGLPECAGVALGVDRLLMLALGERDISKVLAF